MNAENLPAGHENIKSPVERPKRRQELADRIQPLDTGQTEYRDEIPLSSKQEQAQGVVRADLLTKVNDVAQSAGILPEIVPEDGQGKSDFTQLLGGLVEYLMAHFGQEWKKPNGDIDVEKAQQQIANLKPEVLNAPMEHTGNINTLMQREDIQQKITSFIDSYGDSGLLSRDFRNSPHILFKGSENAKVSNEMLPDLAKFAVLFHELTGKPLVITSAYRTIDHQKKLYANSRPGMAAQPGNSNHNTGHAIDIGDVSFQNTKLGGLAGFRLLARNCNFTKIDSEDWHFDHITKRPPGNQSGGRIELARIAQNEFDQKA